MQGTLVVNVENADIVLRLLLKREVETQTGRLLKMMLTGGSEAHLLAEAGVGVALVPSRPFPTEWESRWM